MPRTDFQILPQCVHLKRKSVVYILLDPIRGHPWATANSPGNGPYHYWRGWNLAILAKTNMAIALFSPCMSLPSLRAQVGHTGPARACLGLSLVTPYLDRYREHLGSGKTPVSTLTLGAKSVEEPWCQIGSERTPFRSRELSQTTVTRAFLVQH